MGEEAFDETVFVTDKGTIYIRGGFNRETLWFGMSSGRDDEGCDPQIVTELTQHQVARVINALVDMLANMSEE